jgi:hypothetical protein
MLPGRSTRRMENSLLEALLTSIEAGEAVALVTVVRATGTYAPALGHRALVWLEREPAGELGLGGLTAQV